MHKWRLLQKLYESMSFSIPSAVLIKALSAPMKGRIRALSSNEKPERFLPEISNWLKSPGKMPSRVSRRFNKQSSVESRSKETLYRNSSKGKANGDLCIEP